MKVTTDHKNYVHTVTMTTREYDAFQADFRASFMNPTANVGGVATSRAVAKHTGRRNAEFDPGSGSLVAGRYWITIKVEA